MRSGFSVDKNEWDVNYAQAQDSIVDPGELDLEPDQNEPEFCFSRSQVRYPAYALLDSGATHVLLSGHMLPRGAHSFEVAVNLAVGKEKARCWRNEIYAEDRAHPLLPLGRLANLLGAKCVRENGQVFMQSRDKGTWKTMTQLKSGTTWRMPARSNSKLYVMHYGYNKLSRTSYLTGSSCGGESCSRSQDDYLLASGCGGYYFSSSESLEKVSQLSPQLNHRHPRLS